MNKLVDKFKIKQLDILEYKIRLEQEIKLLTELDYIDYILK